MARFFCACSPRVTATAAALLLAAALSASAQTAPPAEAPSESNRFIVFEHMGYKGRPDFQAFGIQPIYLLVTPSLWPGGDPVEMEQAIRANVQKLARYVTRPPQLVCLDVEHWDLTTADPQQLLTNLAKYALLADWMHQAAPSVRLGYWGILPNRGAQPAFIKNDQPRLEAWRASNVRITPLASHVDVVFPALYTLTEDPQVWRNFAIAALQEARQYHKQVYPFLFPQFLDTENAGAFVPGDFWRVQLETCLEHADGVVIWSHSGAPRYGPDPAWNDDWPWWQETVSFLRQRWASDGASPPITADEPAK